MLETYTCWSGDPDATWEVECFDAGTAAEKYAQHRYEDSDYDTSHIQSLDIHVKGSHGTQKFTIDIQMEPVFHATEVYD